MNEADATKLLLAAASLAAQLTALVPSLFANLQAIKDGLSSEDADALNEQIKGIHADVQSLDGQLQALRS